MMASLNLDLKKMMPEREPQRLVSGVVTTSAYLKGSLRHSAATRPEMCAMSIIKSSTAISDLAESSVIPLSRVQTP